MAYYSFERAKKFSHGNLIFKQESCSFKRLPFELVLLSLVLIGRESKRNVYFTLPSGLSSLYITLFLIYCTALKHCLSCGTVDDCMWICV